LLKAEAFAEEAIALDKTGQHMKICRPLPQIIRQIQESFANGEPSEVIGQQARMLRKKLSPLCFNVNTKRSKKKNNAKPNVPLYLLIANKLWKKNKQHLLGYKKLVKALKINGPYSFDGKGISAKIRNTSKWKVNKAVEKASRGQLLRMINQSINSGTEYNQNDWNGATACDLLGKKRIDLKTPSSSTGEILSDRKQRKEAIKLAVDFGLAEMLKRSISLEKKGEFDRSARMLKHIGIKTKHPYFLVKSANLYERIDDKESEASVFHEILSINPNHPLKFWLGNKIAMEEKIHSLPNRNIVEEQEGSTNIALLGLMGLLSGIGIGLL